MVQQRWAHFLASLANLPNEVADALLLLENLPPIVFRADDPRTYMQPGLTKPTTPQIIAIIHSRHRGQLLLEGAKVAASGTISVAQTFWCTLLSARGVRSSQNPQPDSLTSDH